MLLAFDGLGDRKVLLLVAAALLIVNCGDEKWDTISAPRGVVDISSDTGGMMPSIDGLCLLCLALAASTVWYYDDASLFSLFSSFL